jgi:hypothetical protein
MQVRSYLESEAERSVADFAAPPPGPTRSKDWRTSGLLVPPQDQGDCGSCWAFAGVHAVVDNLRVARNQIIPMASIQQLVCDLTLPGTNGCDGGSPRYIMQALSGSLFSTNRASICDRSPPGVPSTYKCGVVAESCQSYKSSESMQSCRPTCDNGTPRYLAARPLPALVGVGYRDLTGKGVAAIRAAIDIGPVTASFLYYDDFGVFPWSPVTIYSRPPSKKNEKSQGAHAVELVGYGSIGATPYWLVRIAPRSNVTRCRLLHATPERQQSLVKDSG